LVSFFISGVMPPVSTLSFAASRATLLALGRRQARVAATASGRRHRHNGGAGDEEQGSFKLAAFAAVGAGLGKDSMILFNTWV